MDIFLCVVVGYIVVVGKINLMRYFFEREIVTFPESTKVEQELENNNKHVTEQDPSYQAD